MNRTIDPSYRMERIREEMNRMDLDVFIGTRMASVTYVSGAFVPWRAAVLVFRDGHAVLVNFLIDEARVRAESWLDQVVAYAPMPGMDMIIVMAFEPKR